ncbi:MAG: glycerophosphodiester phosphodiesterase [Acidimicrobiales bacterium]
MSWHRGGHEIAPSATLEAFAEAAARGAELIEVDVRKSEDGRLVCVHDPVLGDLGRVDEVAWPALARAGAIDLQTFLDVLDERDPTRRSDVHLDLKATGYEAEAADAVEERGRGLLVTSLEDESIAALRACRPRVPALLTLGRDVRRVSVAAQLKLRRSELVPFRRLSACGATGVASHYLLATPWLRGWCRRQGKTLLVWTVDSEESLRRWLRREVDVITTNRPLVALAMRDGSS